MRIELVRKEDLTTDQLQKLEERIESAIQLEGKCGPLEAWRSFNSGLYAFILTDTKIPIAVAEASGRPTCSPGWWVDPFFRGKGYGNELVDLLARFLLDHGVTGVGRISIQTPNNNYDAQSSKLAKRLRSYFED